MSHHGGLEVAEDLNQASVAVCKVGDKIGHLGWPMAGEKGVAIANQRSHHPDHKGTNDQQRRFHRGVGFFRGVGTRAVCQDNLAVPSLG